MATEWESFGDLEISFTAASVEAGVTVSQPTFDANATQLELDYSAAALLATASVSAPVLILSAPSIVTTAELGHFFDAYFRDFFEQVSFAEAQVFTVSPRYIDEVLASDELAFSASLKRSDGYSLVDAPSVGLSKSPDASVASLGDSLEALGVGKSLADQSLLQDALEYALGLELADDEAVIQEALLFALGAQLSDGISSSDGAPSFGTGKGLSDTVAPTEAIELNLTFFRSFSEAVILQDRAVIPTSFDFLGAVDVLSFAAKPHLGISTAFIPAGSDGLVTADGLEFTFGHSKAELSDLVDAVGTGKALFDAVSFSDDISIFNVVNISFADAFSLGDLATLGGVTHQDDVLGFGDTPSLSLGRALGDGAGLSDFALLGSGKSFFDSTSFSDSISITNAISRTLTDAFSLDDLATVGGLIKETTAHKQNVLGFSDSESLSLSKILEGDSVSFSEDVQVNKRSLNSSLLNSSALNTSALNA